LLYWNYRSDVIIGLRIISLRQAHTSVYRRVMDAPIARPSIAALATPRRH